MAERARTIQASQIRDAVAQIFKRICIELPGELIQALRDAREREDNATARDVLDKLIENQEIALREQIPTCQDTGLAVVFLEIGQDVHIVGGTVQEAVNGGVRAAYTEGYLRRSVVRSPLDRENTGDNTPALVHMSLTPGSKLRIYGAAKGAGSENKSALAMLNPGDGVEGVERFVLRTVQEAGAAACPPLIVGVGIGGDLESCALLAKRALLRKLGQPSADSAAAKLEKKLLESINALGIGPLGFGGRTTTLAVHVELLPCHIASLPVAVNLNCHADRWGTAEL
jgi:fumarate hydratase subunit alpha